MARPKKNPDEARTEVARFRVTSAELHHLHQQAQAAGLSLSDLVRQRALKGRVRVPRNRASGELLTELNRIGVNLNQIAHMLNRGGDTPQDLQFVMHQLFQVLEQVGRSYDS
jgi:hypothetical protein